MCLGIQDRETKLGLCWGTTICDKADFENQVSVSRSWHQFILSPTLHERIELVVSQVRDSRYCSAFPVGDKRLLAREDLYRYRRWGRV